MTGNVGQATLELVANAHAALGEGPVWDEDRGVPWWVDVSAGLVHRFDPSSGADRATDVGSMEVLRRRRVTVPRHIRVEVPVPPPGAAQEPEGTAVGVRPAARPDSDDGTAGLVVGTSSQNGSGPGS